MESPPSADNRLKLDPSATERRSSFSRWAPRDVEGETGMPPDPYRMPTLRRAVVRVMRWALRVRRVLSQLRGTSGWTIALVSFALLALAIHTWGLAIALVVMLAINTALWTMERRRHELANVAETDSLSGREFERWLEDFFERLGFQVERTPYQGDFGADLIITWNGIRTAVQAKSGHFNAGVSAVQQAAAAQAFYGCERAMVVTNQYFTTQAIVLAEANGVVMRSRDDLARKLQRLD